MAESTSSPPSSGVGDVEEPQGIDEDVTMAIDYCPTGPALTEPLIPDRIPPHPPEMRSIIRRLRRQDLQLQSSHMSPDSPPSEGEMSVAGSVLDYRDKYQEGCQGTEGCTSDASSSTLFPKWMEQQNVQLDLDAGHMSSSGPRVRGIVEYTVTSANLAPSWTTTPASPSLGGPTPGINGPGILVPDTCKSGTDIASDDSLLPGKFDLTADLTPELPTSGLQAMMIHAKLRASLPRLASGVNRRDLVRFHLSDEVAQHCSSRVLNRVYKPARTRVRGKVPARKPAATPSGAGEKGSAARPTPSVNDKGSPSMETGGAAAL
ncbi:hypothetical protein MCOR25_011063 [Pyricularia grisea]|uniref:Uncharacterized protein n=1 Tax=Pyricularia grisea TaxID=148305 RepID=A0A6P8B9W8_PYRGI|nr:uncharacterized protein PgNI_03339 [Pyricularia grisea]KAI6345076.1 hypothetical protein MCOR25_011063 [Pyricularia grisea]TLD12606.1 hypothetical protein PgNI_03339 [Pyricularia grisea]